VNGTDHQGWPNETCNPDSSTMLWIWNGGTPAGLTINGEPQSGSWVHEGNGAWHFTATIDSTNYPPVTASVSYTGSNDFLRLSGCDEGGTTTTTTSSSTSTGTETSSSTSTGTETSSSTSTGTETSSVTTSQSTTSSVTTQVTTTSSQQTTAASTTTAQTPNGSVEGATGTPQLTLPPTDAMSSASSQAPSGSWSLLLAAGVVLTLAILVLTPAAKTRRKR
jgi:hypothetical protein